MSQITLMIQPSDVISLNNFDGNIDVDNLKPFIYTAQTTHLKSFLGLQLYDKIYNDFVNDDLSGEYLILFEDFIKDFLSYYTSSLYVTFGGYKVSENGLHKITSDNMTVLDYSETEKLSLKFTELVAGVEANFKAYVFDKNIPELAEKIIEIETGFSWY
jgi:hypothetical protein